MSKAIELVKMTNGVDSIKMMFDKMGLEVETEKLYTFCDAVATDIAKCLTANFQEEELDQLVQFYKTEAGKKFLAFQPKMQQEAFDIGQSHSDILL